MTDGGGGDEGRAARQTLPGLRYSPVEGGDATALAVLSTWSVLEALSPRTYRDPRDLAEGPFSAVGPLHPQAMPWDEPGVPREDYAFFYRIALGAIDMRGAHRMIMETYGQDEGAAAARAELALMAMLLTDGRGVPLSRGHSVSSFAWALPVVLGGDLSGMGRWSEAEAVVLQEVSGILVRQDEEGNTLPVTWDQVAKAHEHLVTRFKVPPELVSPPTFSIRIEHRRRGASEPQPYLLNSFYLSDLDKASELVEAGKAPVALGAYLGVLAPSRPMDVLDGANIARLVAVDRTPHVRWPSPDGSPLVTLQQAAVNSVVYGLGQGERSGILAVNGPPGTGKTTLLRDVVASCVLERAKALAEFENPDDAFSKAPLPADQPVGRRPWRLHGSLKGHEVIVASTNNRAVENVSRELPLRKAVGRPDLGLTHMRVVADALAGIGRDPEAPGDPDGPDACWGLVSAALGNSENRHRFMQTFWWDEDHGVRTWLRLARGDKVTVHVKDRKGRILKSRPPHMLQGHDGPVKAHESANLWRRARRAFRDKSAEVEAAMDGLAAFQLAVRDHGALGKLVDAARAEVERLSGSPSAAARLIDRRASVGRAVEAAEGTLARHAATEPPRGVGEPGLEWKLWEADRVSHEVVLASLREKAGTLASVVAGDAADEAAAFDAAMETLADLTAQAAAQDEVLARFHPEVGARVVDSAFFNRGPGSWNLASPWIPDRVHALREELFKAAMDLHSAFAAAAAGKVLLNLSCFADISRQGGVPAELQGHLHDLWATVHLVVPVISTTFASVSRMLEGLGPAELGWLVVDEAGQAMPQAAVGALTRCKRAVVVGDPLQIEPVDQLPVRLVGRMCDHFGVDQRAWAGPFASVQSLADRASPMQSSVGRGDGARRIGMPLLVHRRCQEPMFGISNAVAYEGGMVHAAGNPPEGDVARVLGPSAWFDVTGGHEGKWCPEQGEATVRLLAELAGAGAFRPDLFVITPFRDVALGMQRRIATEGRLMASLGEDAASWARSRVGTIHTFQGREAEAVLLVLGAGDGSHVPARSWAGGTPNIVNVAVSRARLNLYVMGEYAAWADAGAFSHVSGALDLRDCPGYVQAPPAPPPAPRRITLAGRMPPRPAGTSLH